MVFRVRFNVKSVLLEEVTVMHETQVYSFIRVLYTHTNYFNVDLFNLPVSPLTHLLKVVAEMYTC